MKIRMKIIIIININVIECKWVIKSWSEDEHIIFKRNIIQYYAKINSKI